MSSWSSWKEMKVKMIFLASGYPYLRITTEKYWKTFGLCAHSNEDVHARSLHTLTRILTRSTHTGIIKLDTITGQGGYTFWDRTIWSLGDFLLNLFSQWRRALVLAGRQRRRWHQAERERSTGAMRPQRAINSCCISNLAAFKLRDRKT